MEFEASRGSPTHGDLFQIQNKTKQQRLRPKAQSCLVKDLSLEPSRITAWALGPRAQNAWPLSCTAWPAGVVPEHFPRWPRPCVILKGSCAWYPWKGEDSPKGKVCDGVYGKSYVLSFFLLFLSFQTPPGASRWPCHKGRFFFFF